MTYSRPTILVLNGHYLPAFKAGGPVRSIANLIEAMGDEFDFRVICADRDLGDGEPYREIARDRWISVGRTPVHYTFPGLQSLSGLAHIVRETPHDILYLNSFFSPRFTIRPLVARRLGLIPSRPLVIAPRGEFSSGALALKAAKKQAWIGIGGRLGLFSDVTWQASSEHEADDIRAALPKHARSIHVARNLPAPLATKPPTHAPRAPSEPLRIIFLSRISPKKNLGYALRALSQVEAPVAFSIYGPPEDATYQAECERLAAQLPPHVRVRWFGPVDPADVPRVMAEHDLFFLPTRGENFGHVVAEALGAGTPVLLSDTTPWRGLAQLGIGDDLPLAEPAAFVAAIERTAAQSAQEAMARRERASTYARQRHQNMADIEANRQLFAMALKKR